MLHKNTTPFRYAVLAAVSTQAQAAADKVSIPEQVRLSREAGANRGWFEAAGPYEIPGHSRTKYVNLSDAERAIPPLRAMLEAAKRREFDILIVYHLNRLRDLLDAVYRSLGAYKVQIYSVSQPVEPVPLEAFNYETSDTMRIIVTMSQMTSQAEIADIRKRWNAGMPARVIQRGLPANSPPFGYRRNLDRKQPPKIDLRLARVVVHMKDMALGGESTMRIANHLNDLNISPPRASLWNANTVRGILINPFYAGWVVWGKSRVVRDLRAGTRARNRQQNKDEVTLVKGRHAPLWDDAVHEQLKDSLKRRRRQLAGRLVNQFTGLLRCSICGSTLWRQGNGPQGEHRVIWRCRMSNEHVNIPHVIAVEKIGAELVRVLEGSKSHALVELKDQPDVIGSEIARLKSQCKRLEDAYQVGAIGIESLMQRSAGLKNEIDRLEKMEISNRVSSHQRQRLLETVGEIEKMISVLPQFIMDEAPREVHRILMLLAAYIEVTPDHQITIVFN